MVHELPEFSESASVLSPVSLNGDTINKPAALGS